MLTSIQLYTRTTAQWAASPDNAVVLKAGQPGIELLASGKFAVKIGNGVGVWSALGYVKADVLDSIRSEIDALRTARSFKQTVKACATGNVSSLSGATTLDDIDIDPGDSFLLAFQTNPSENGVYVMPSLGAWTRREDMDGSGDRIGGSVVRVESGTIYGGREFTCMNSNPFILGLDGILFLDTSGDNYANSVEIDITGGGSIDLSAYRGYGIINLTSSNATENIDSIVVHNWKNRIMLRPASGLAVTFNDQTTVTGNIHLPSSGTTFVADGSDDGFIEIQFRGTEAYMVGGVGSYN